MTDSPNLYLPYLLLTTTLHFNGNTINCVCRNNYLDCHGKVSNYVAGGARLTMKLKTNYMKMDLMNCCNLQMANIFLKIKKHNWNKTSLFLLIYLVESRMTD